MASVPAQAENQGTPSTIPYAVYARLKDQYRELQAFVKWEDELFGNHHLSGNQKLGIRATRRAVRHAQIRDEQGRARINLTTIAGQIGVSPDTMSRGLKVLEKCGVISDHDVKAETQENGERWTRHYVALDDDVLSKPKDIKPPEPRNHGGDHMYCQKCGSRHVKVKKKTTTTLICMNKGCGHEVLVSETETEQVLNPDDEQPQETASCELGGKLRDTLKTDTPPYDAGDHDAAIPTDQGDPDSEVLGKVPARADDPGASCELGSNLHVVVDSSDGESTMADLEAAAELLLAVAGPGDDHIEMSRRGEKKYFTVDRRLTIEDLMDHLRGGKARGALCQHPDDQTRSLCWDADDIERWERLEDAARALAALGWLPILEPSPAGRGGHLWVVFTDLVSASAARSQVHAVAPELASLVEYWPGPQAARRWNRVRLPGGRYVRPGVDAWCHLTSVADGETSTDGQSAARLLLTHQTPASVVPSTPDEGEAGVGGLQGTRAPSDALPGPGVENPPARSASDGRRPACGDAVQGFQESPGADPGQGAGILPTSNRADQADPPASRAQPDQVDEETLAKGRLWFEWGSASYLARWYNERHSVDELLPSERNGFGLASWRGERTASVAKDKAGLRWADFGASARRPDGSPDTGDPFELLVRLSGKPKGEVFREVSHELLAEAVTALESAARSDQPLPAWLEEIITPAGWAHYWQLAAQAGHQVGMAEIRNDELHPPSGPPGAADLSSTRATDHADAPPPIPGRNLLEAFWSVGKQHDYPALPDLGLAAGKLAWNSFSLGQRRRIPEVLERLE